MFFCIYFITIYRSQILLMTDITSYRIKKFVAVMTVCCAVMYLTSLGEHLFFQVISEHYVLLCSAVMLVANQHHNKQHKVPSDRTIPHACFVCGTSQYFIQSPCILLCTFFPPCNQQTNISFCNVERKS